MPQRGSCSIRASTSAPSRTSSDGEGPGRLAPTVRGRPGVEDAHAVAGLVERDVRVPEDDEVGGREAARAAGPCGPGAGPLSWIIPMRSALELDLERLGRTPLGDLGHVVVAHDDVHRRERREQVEDVGGADVPGVQDDVGRLEVREQRRRAGLPVARRVGVGDDEDPHDRRDLTARARAPRAPWPRRAAPCSRSRASGRAPSVAAAAAAATVSSSRDEPSQQVLDRVEPQRNRCHPADRDSARRDRAGVVAHDADDRLDERPLRLEPADRAEVCRPLARRRRWQRDAGQHLVVGEQVVAARVGPVAEHVTDRETAAAASCRRWRHTSAGPSRGTTGAGGRTARCRRRRRRGGDRRGRGSRRRRT